MTDQKHTKEPKVGEKIWVEMIVTYYDKETKLIRIDPLSSPHAIGEALVGQGSIVSRHSPFDLRRQRDELREALERIVLKTEEKGRNPEMLIGEIRYFASEVLTKTKGDV